MDGRCLHRADYLVCLFSCLPLCFCGQGTAGEMKQSVKIDASNWRVQRNMFGTYGYRPQQSVLTEAGGFRFWLPAGMDGVTQTGVYSYFVFAGDFEVTCSYEFLNVQSPKTGRGNGVGLAVDVGDEGGRAVLQRLETPFDGSGYSLFSWLGEGGERTAGQYHFVPTSSKGGRMGLRRLSKDLIFLAPDTPGEPLHEIGRHTFTKETIRTVQFFADPGGSPMAVHARLRDIEVQAEEITGGVPQRDAAANWWWLWLLFPASSAVLLVWRWRANR